MSVQSNTEVDTEIVDRGRICSAPSCWEPGDPIAIEGRGVVDDPVLCETHRKAYLGVST